MMVKPEYGGAGMDTVSYVLAMEEISKIDASVSVAMSVNNSLVCYGLQEYATEEQKQQYLVPLAQGRKDGELYIGAFLLSEPEAGSDATSQRTTAEDKGDYYLLNGTKNWITNGGSAYVGKAKVGMNGTWTFDFNPNTYPSEGTHTFIAYDTDFAGNVGSSSLLTGTFVYSTHPNGHLGHDTGASPTDEPGVVLAGGAYRNGVLLAPLVARLVADHIETGSVEPAVDPRRFRMKEDG